MTYIDVVPTQNTAAAPIHCTSAMSDACLNAGDIQFDASGNFLFVSDVINHRIRVLQIDANNKMLRDTGSAIPFTGALFFSPDDSLVFAIPDTDTQVHVFSFDQSSGGLTPKGSPIAPPVPFSLVASIRR
jgi:6-phosphogluconolactonase (cycloisomerase 2 family)